MSTLKKNKRIKLAKRLALYGDVKPSQGNQITRRGKAKYLGGNGRKTTGISRRAFKMNLQRIRVVEDGVIVHRRVPVSLLRSGLVQKPVVRAPFTIEALEVAKETKAAKGARPSKDAKASKDVKATKNVKASKDAKPAKEAKAAKPAKASKK